jgi:hypothetical protein
MPGEDTHGLQIALATALRERDEARDGDARLAAANKALADDLIDKCHALGAAESERDALRTDVKRLRDALEGIGPFLSGCLCGAPADCSRCQALRARRAALATGGDRG